MTDKTTFENIRNTIETYLPEMIALRHDLHQNPELSHKEVRTSKIVADLLKKWGFDVTTGIGGTGVVGTLKVGNGKKSVGIRADMDALPITELTNLPYSSKNEGVMHACGHDGHTTILLTAARYLAENKNFDGTLHLFFQPAEETLTGAKAMIDDGLFEKFPVDAVFGMHNAPITTTNQFLFVDNAMMASADIAHITIHGKGGHGAMPHTATDPVVATGSIIMALQTIVSRNVPPSQAVAISIGRIAGGEVANVIPDNVSMSITIRTVSPEARSMVKERIHTIVCQQAESFGCSADIDYKNLAPVLINTQKETDFARNLATELFGTTRVNEHSPFQMASEDFSYMLEKAPGCYLNLGGGGDVSVHNPHYNFNDDTILDGASYWVALTQNFLKD